MAETGAGEPLIRADLDLVIPPGTSLDQAIGLALQAIDDALVMDAIVWPARDACGRLVPPPRDHVLDRLAREYEFGDPDALAEDEMRGWSGANTVAVLDELPRCSLCTERARYDASVTASDGRRVGAFLCGPHYGAHGQGTLGATGDVYLLLCTEVDDEIRATCNQLLAAQGRDPLFADDGSFC